MLSSHFLHLPCPIFTSYIHLPSPPPLPSHISTLTSTSTFTAPSPISHLSPPPPISSFLQGLVNVLGMWIARRSERVHRKIFYNAKLFREELLLSKAVCNDVQRLLMNTLPEPIVREIATGTSKVAHRYENVTVLQADMVGFTPLSAARGPEEVLGILSELFADFDRAAERWGVHKVKSISDAHPHSAPSPLPPPLPLHPLPRPSPSPLPSPSLQPKVKTIGDAYIICSGAFAQVGEHQEAAKRVVQMGLSMQYIVAQKAFSAGADISVRTGIDPQGHDRPRPHHHHHLHAPPHAHAHPHAHPHIHPHAYPHPGAHRHPQGHGHWWHHWHRALPLRHVGQWCRWLGTHGGAVRV